MPPTPGQPVATVLTPPGAGGVAVIALTGPGVDELLGNLFRPHISGAELRSGRLRLGHLVRDGGILDEVLVARSVDGAEINVHGGPATQRAILEALAAAGARIAPAGGDPLLPTCHPHWDNPAVGAELLSVLPRAHGPLPVAVVAAQWSGGLSELAATVVDTPTPDAAEPLRRAADRLALVDRLLNPAEVVLAGPPNAGKSSLANALVGRAVSIVSDVPGTTRDWVRERALVDGVPIWITDTTGLWDAPGHIDAEAVRRAWHRMEQADLVVLLSAGPPPDLPERVPASQVLAVRTQADRTDTPDDGRLSVSAETGDGLDALQKTIRQAIGLRELDPSAPAAFTSRQAELLRHAADAAQAERPDRARQILDQLLGRDRSTVRARGGRTQAPNRPCTDDK